MKPDRADLNLGYVYCICFFSIGPFLNFYQFLRELLVHQVAKDIQYMQFITLLIAIPVLLFLYKKAAALKLILLVHIFIGIAVFSEIAGLAFLCLEKIDNSNTTIPGLLLNVLFMLLSWAIIPAAMFGISSALSFSYKKISQYLENKSYVEKMPSVT